MTNNLVWFRNDLRTYDNLALNEACQKEKKVIAIYCFDPRQFEKDCFGFKKTEKFRAKFLIETVFNLKDNLKIFNIPLLIFNQKPEEIIPEICQKYAIKNIYFQKEWTSDEIKIENALKEKLPEKKFKSLYNQFLFAPDEISFNYNDTPRVFTAFRQKIEKHDQVSECFSPKKMPIENLISENNITFSPNLKALGFDDFEIDNRTAFPFKGGENEGLKRVKEYLFETKYVSKYKQTRNGLIGKDYSTKFSAWLANGSLSAKTIYWEIKKYEDQHGANDSTYWVFFELLWRDFFKYTSLKHGNQLFKINGFTNRTYEWHQNKRLVNQWIEGQTHEPFVNANMIELKNTGWMSNRGRQNVASYFAKQLKLDWRIGAAYFESVLIDYDVHSNYGNWQYVAGVGNDPRDRQFNVQLQAKNYDPSRDYQNLWLN